MAKLSFDANDVPPQEDFTPVPDGWYPAIITESESIATASKNGSYLKLVFTITGEKYAKRNVFLNLNLDNPNAVAVEIAQKGLSAICHAVGILKISDSAQLHNKPLQIKIGIESATLDSGGGIKYDAKNTIKGYKKFGEGMTATQPSPAWIADEEPTAFAEAIQKEAETFVDPAPTETIKKDTVEVLSENELPAWMREEPK